MPGSLPTIREVALKAGVSHQTVSRVINGDERVRPETRARVEAAIAELGFRPNPIARAMARGRTNTLACLAPNLTDYTFASIIDGAEREARLHGHFLLSSSAPNEASFAVLLEQILAGRRIDGLLVINPYADGRHRLLPARFPTVFIGASPRDDAVDSVSLDDAGMARQAVEHLLSNGHRRIGMVTGPLVEDCSQDRCQGYRAALQAAGIPYDAALQVEGDWSATSGYNACLSLSRLSPAPTAIFAQNDRMAVGVLRAARELGLSVPGDLAVVGVDDMPLASFIDPPLTTMRQDMGRIGCEAVRLLLRAVDQPGAVREHLRLPAELVIRQSTERV